MNTDNHKRSCPILLNHPGLLNDSRCNSSSTEAGVLMAISGHGPTPPEGGSYCNWRVDLDPHHYYTHRQERESAYLSSGIRTRGAPK
ncbi:hypothetical protein AVEN_233062-1 [Araneus ventricosus]|uniref:Uncharacterized protein n=1 Tax=Araneus ventricosus TaxID=182803 RepID=A0A4Y2SAJ0_ARAVE|nr:hypothetical protein AVEN_30693-1 [Araneus ventricosus]GBN70201.1 hypothetical protein AVEN_123188-1 [Araneus ventricosus]GBN84863.1 hypothetical protein AVEN_233062-1 [Araneus ventricosus]